MAEKDTNKENDSVSKSELSELLDGRCVKCRFWEGDRDYVIKLFNEAEDKTYFLSHRDVWIGDGVCSQFVGSFCTCFEPNGTFGCIFFAVI